MEGTDTKNSEVEAITNSTTISAANKSCVDMWHTISGQPTMADKHTFNLVVCWGTGFIVQGYYGQYSFNGWLAFDTDLMRDPLLPPPAVPEYNTNRVVVPKPRYRGMLNDVTLKALGADIDLLTTKRADHKTRLSGTV